MRPKKQDDEEEVEEGSEQWVHTPDPLEEGEEQWVHTPDSEDDAEED